MSGAVWEATLQIANTTSGEKVLYDIDPIKKVERASSLATTSTTNSKPQTADLVKNPNVKYVPGHQFQMFENMEETDNLVAVHNKSVSGLAVCGNGGEIFKRGYPPS